MTRKRKTGLPPGTPVYTGDQIPSHTDITLLRYNDDEINIISDFQSIDFTIKDKFYYWLDVRGVFDPALVEKLGHKFSIHPLVMEDILDVNQRPKLDEFEHAIFITVAALKSEIEGSKLSKEQVTLYFGSNYLISFQEDPDDLLKIIRDRMFQKKGKIRQKGPDYLAYCIIDFVVDHYYEALDNIEQKLSQLDENIHKEQANISNELLHDLKVQIIRIRKAIYPVREVINKFIRSEHSLISPDTDIYLRDLADHSVQIADLSETFQDMLNSLHDLYQAEISNRMNNVMKILTIISTIFIPLNFIAGMYGMNFKYMPELEDPNGYYIVLGIMFVIAIAFLIYFKRKKWI